jgi:hypothetical protein
MDAIAGPNAKTPGIFFAVLSMALVASRRWFWAAFVGSLAFLVWQPLAVYAAIAVLVAPLVAPAGERRRAFGLAVAGAAIPVTVTVIYFWLVGALSKMIVAAFVFPATGIQRGPQTLTARLKHIASVVDSGYGHSGRLFWAGLVLLFVLFAVHLLRGRSDLRKALLHPLVSVVLPTLLVVIAFSATDFQGYPDLYPLLPYAALGLGGTAAVAVQLLPAPVLRQAAVAGALVCVLALTVLSWSWFSNDRTVNGKLAVQRVEACSLNRAVGPNGTLYAMGDPTSLVLTGRRNPTRFIYLNSGVADWDISHTPGGYRGWKAKVQATHADVIVVHDWYSRTAQKTTKWLMSAYDSAYIGRWHVFLAPGVRARAEQSGVALLARAGRPTRPTGGSGSGRC